MKKRSFLALLPILIFGAFRLAAKTILHRAPQKNNLDTKEEKNKNNSLVYAAPAIIEEEFLTVENTQEEFLTAESETKEIQNEINNPFYTKKADEGIKILSEYFESEEEVILYFFEMLKREELYEMLACFSRIKSEDDKAFVDKIFVNGKFVLNSDYPLEYNLYRDINEISVLNERAKSILGFISSLILNEDNPINYLKKDGKEIKIESFQDAITALDALDTQYLDTIDVLEINMPNIYLMDSKTTFNYFKKHASISGALDKTERTVLFSYNEKQYFVSFTLVKFEDGWKLENFGAELSLSTPPGFYICYRTNKDEYLELIK